MKRKGIKVSQNDYEELLAATLKKGLITKDMYAVFYEKMTTFGKEVCSID